MARIRSIKPELASDMKLAKCSRDARYTFVLLISQSDDEGLIAGSPRQLLGALYPHDEDVSASMVIGWLNELSGVGLVHWRETTEGVPVICLSKWKKHQRIDNKGRSQLLGLLMPAGSAPRSDETIPAAPDREPPPMIAPPSDVPRPLAEVRGEPPRVAAVRGLEVGSRKKEVGNRSEEVGAPAATVAASALTVEFDFGPCAESVDGLIRAARSPAAVIATLRMHLSGELDHELATPRELGLACQQYSANGQPFNAAYFAGFVRRAKTGAERTQNRRRNEAETKSIATEQDHRAEQDAEERAADQQLEQFAADHPGRYSELSATAESMVPASITLGREIIVRQQLLRLIRDNREAA